MPAFLEADLEKSGKKKGFHGERLKHYIFGAMNNIGAMHGSAETAKGRAMEAKHKADMLRKSKKKRKK